MASVFKVGASGVEFEVDDSGNATVPGALTVGGDVAVDAVAASESVGVVPAANGAALTLEYADATVTLSTSGAESTFNWVRASDAGSGIPAGAILLAVMGLVTTAIAGCGAGATWGVTLTGGATDGTISGVALTAGSHAESCIPSGSGVLAVGSAIQGKIVISGGAGSDNTPSAGAVRVRAYFFRPTALTA